MTIIEPSKFEKVFMWGAILMMIPLFLALSRPAWDAPRMIGQITENCQKRHGVLLVNEGRLGTTYSCESYLGPKEATR